MKNQLQRRIKELRVELEAVQKLMDELENGSTKSKSADLRGNRRAISGRWVFGLMLLAAFLLLGGNLQSQQKSDNALFIDASGQVGIGTVQPKAQLEVRAPAGSATAIRFGDTAGSAGLIAGSTYFGLRDAADNDRLTILQSNGRVGIGTTDPNRLVELKRQGSDTEFSLNERLFLDGSAGTVRITNNAYVQNGSWAIKDKTKRAFTLEIRDSGMLELYGTKTAGQADWQKMATFDAPNNQVIFPSGNLKVNGLQIGNTVIGEPELQILKKLAAGQLVVDLFNTTQGEYLYAADFAPYDNDRRRVFTWRRKTRINQGYWMLQYPR